MPYEQRVDRALSKVLGSRAWTGPQRQWLERIGAQMKANTVVDRTALDEGDFKHGGFARLDKQFERRLGGILGELAAGVWDVAG